jgi:hypothetical protein
MKYYIYTFEIILISIIFLLIIESNSNNPKENFDVSSISSIKKLKIFNYKTVEPIIKNEIIQDVQAFDKQIFEYKDGGN